jgi:hypothetical protein
MPDTTATNTLLKELLTELEDQTQIQTELTLKLIELLLQLLLLLRNQARPKEPLPMLLPWLLNINKHSTRTPPLEPSMLTRMLLTMSFITNGYLDTTHQFLTNLSGLKLPTQEIKILELGV